MYCPPHTRVFFVCATFTLQRLKTVHSLYSGSVLWREIHSVVRRLCTDLSISSVAPYVGGIDCWVPVVLRRKLCINLLTSVSYATLSYSGLSSHFIEPLTAPHDFARAVFDGWNNSNLYLDVFPFPHRTYHNSLPLLHGNFFLKSTS